MPDHVVEHLLVAALLEGVQRDRFADQRIGDRVGEGLHAERGDAFGLDRDTPERQAGEAGELRAVERGPGDDRRFIGIVRVEQHAAEQLLVRVGANRNASGLVPPPGCSDMVD